MAGVILDIAHQTRQCQKLLASVVANAMRDLASDGWQRAWRKPRPNEARGPRNMGISSHAFTAARFLFDETSTGVDAYLEWLDIDSDEFRRRTIELIYDTRPRDIAGWTPEQRRAMRINYEVWRKIRHQDTSTLEESEDD